ncbi:MAG: hypothetical protein BGP13_17260 [Sphingobacteriales bacterium 40-81]|nr:MAG: hypothetical protein BGP13_17260 [Sphingobacteriales bacterium 40-81]
MLLKKSGRYESKSQHFSYSYTYRFVLLKPLVVLIITIVMEKDGIAIPKAAWRLNMFEVVGY